MKTKADIQREEQFAREENQRLLREARRELENKIYNSATDMREFLAMCREIPKRLTFSEAELPRDQMTAADYVRACSDDRDVMGRRIK